MTDGDGSRAAIASRAGFAEFMPYQDLTACSPSERGWTWGEPPGADVGDRANDGALSLVARETIRFRRCFSIAGSTRSNQDMDDGPDPAGRLQFLGVTMTEGDLIAQPSQAFLHLPRNGDRAVSATGTTERQRQVAPTFPLESREQKTQQSLEML